MAVTTQEVNCFSACLSRIPDFAHQNRSFTSGRYTTVLAELRKRADPRCGAIAPPKTYDSSFIHNDFIQFRKQHSLYEVILSSSLLQ